MEAHVTIRGARKGQVRQQGQWTGSADPEDLDDLLRRADKAAEAFPGGTVFCELRADYRVGSLARLIAYVVEAGGDIVLSVHGSTHYRVVWTPTPSALPILFSSAEVDGRPHTRVSVSGIRPMETHGAPSTIWANLKLEGAHIAGRKAVRVATVEVG